MSTGYLIVIYGARIYTTLTISALLCGTEQNRMCRVLLRKLTWLETPPLLSMQSTHDSRKPYIWNGLTLKNKNYVVSLGASHCHPVWDDLWNKVLAVNGSV